MDLDIYSRSRSPMRVAVVKFRGMAMMFAYVPVFNTSGHKYGQDPQQEEGAYDLL